MLFTSYEFLGFLALTFLAYFLSPKRFRTGVLLTFSWGYYLLSGGWTFVFLLLTSITIWFSALKLSALHAAQAARLKTLKAEKGALSREEKKSVKEIFLKRRRKWLYAGLLLNLGILAVCKYTNFAIVNVNGLLHSIGQGELPLVELVLPLGISFYTFRSLGYLIDVYRGTQEAERSFLRFALFVSFFPQLVQGPISRFGELSKTLFAAQPFCLQTFSFGMQRILWGYFKKLVIADRLLPAVNQIIHDPAAYGGAWAFAGMLFYALELYADFTGGIDITIGIAEAMGIKVEENFIRPYFSKSIKEYWNRWHITMGSWFTDYIFYPISVSGPMLKLSKWGRGHLGGFIGKRLTVWVSCFTVWFATGIWHGASWNFIVWGLANCLVILISQELEPLYRRFSERVNKNRKTPLEDSFCWKLFQILRTVLLMSALRMFDCYRDVPLTFRMFFGMFSASNWSLFTDGSLMNLGLSAGDYLLLACGLICLLSVSLIQRRGGVRLRIAGLPYALRFCLFFGLFLTVLVFGAYGVGFDASQFIYNQF